MHVIPILPSFSSSSSARTLNARCRHTRAPSSSSSSSSLWHMMAMLPCVTLVAMIMMMMTISLPTPTVALVPTWSITWRYPVLSTVVRPANKTVTTCVNTTIPVMATCTFANTSSYDFIMANSLSSLCYYRNGTTDTTSSGSGYYTTTDITPWSVAYTGVCNENMTSDGNLTVTITPSRISTKCTSVFVDPTKDVNNTNNGPWLAVGQTIYSAGTYYPAAMGAAMPSDSTTSLVGWTVNITWAYRPGIVDSDLLCDAPPSSYAYDAWGHLIAGTVLLTRRGTCAFGIKAANAAALGAIGIIITPASSTDSPSTLIGSQNVTIPMVQVSWLFSKQITDVISLDPYQYGSSVRVTFRGGSTATNAADLAAMKAIYMANPSIQQDTNWGGSLSWSYLMDGYDPCVYKFQGVWCFENRIYSLALSGLGWKGAVPNGFANIARLTTLDLSNNQLTGSIPCWSLPELQQILVNDNQLTGICLTGFTSTSFRWVDGSSNLITTLPVAMPYMYYYYFRSNPIVNASALYGMPWIYEVDVYGCGITGWPLPDFNQWTGMDIFIGGFNSFTGTIRNDTFIKAVWLHELDLSYNNLTGIVPLFDPIYKRMVTLDLSHNQLTGTIPLAWKTTLPILTTLNMGHNQLVSPIDPLASLAKLSWLDMSYNHITATTNFANQDGQIGVVFGAMPATITYMDFSHNDLYGIWTPGWMSKLPLLTTLKLNDNLIKEGLPDEAFTFNSVIQILDLSNNNFTGPITNTPPGSSLQYIKLDGNQLHGGVLPVWATQFSPRVVSALGQFSCQQYTLASASNVQLFIDASYHDYTGCECDRGTFGSPPDCEFIPPTSNATIAMTIVQPPKSSSNPNGEPMSTFSPNEYGDQRQTVGMDTSWLMAPPVGPAREPPVVIYLKFDIDRSLFNAATDRLDIFTGGVDLSGTRVMTYLGTDASYTGNVASLGITDNIDADMIVIFASQATVNFRSRDAAGQHFIANFTYGYDCPAPYRTGANGQCETGIRVGDMIAQKLSGTSIVLAFGISVLGSWTSLILVEQAIFHHLAKLVTWPWLALSSCSLGGGMWATLLIGLASISVPPLGVSFAAAQSIAPLVLPFALIYAAFYILLGRAAPLYFSRRGAGSESMTMKSVLSVESSMTSNGTKRKKRAHHTWMTRFKDALKFHGLAAAILVTGALIGTHWAMFSGITIAANLHYNVGIIIIGMILGFIGCGSATHLFFHFRTSQFRFISAFIMAAGICAMHFVTLNAIDYEYNGRVLSEAPFDSTILQILGSVSMALMSFLFIGLNVVRLKLSRDHLEKDVRDARMQIESLQNLVMIERSISADLQRKLDLINLCRPLTRTTSASLATILAASQHDRDEMLKIYKRALDHQKPGAVNEGGVLHDDGNGSDDDTNGAAQLRSPAHKHVDGVTNLSKGDSPDNTPNPRARMLNQGATTTNTSHGDVGGYAPVSSHDVLAPQPNALGVITSSSGDNLASLGTPIHREESPLLSAPGRGGRSSQANGSTTPTNTNTSGMVPTTIGSPSNVVVQLPGTPQHGGDVAAAAPRSSVISPPSPRSGDTPPPLVTGKSFAGNTNIITTPSTAVTAAPTPINGMSAGLASVRGVSNIAGLFGAVAVSTNNNSSTGSPGPSSRMPAGATANKYTISTRAPVSSSNVTVPTPTNGHGHAAAAGYAPAPAAHSVSTHDVGEELMLVAGAAGARPSGVHGNANLNDTQITLDVIMAHPVCVEILKDRLALLHASETLQLYLEIQNYKRSPQAQLKRLATDIYDAYIQVHSENQVNFGATLRESIAKRVREPRPGHQCFKEAEREAHRLLMQNAWPSFRDSVQFTMCAIIIRGLIPPPDRPRGGPSIHWQAVAAASDISTDSGSMVTDTHSRKSSLPHVGEHDIHGAGKDDDEREEKNDTDAVRTYEPVHTNASVANANANHSLPTPSMRVVEA